MMDRDDASRALKISKAIQPFLRGQGNDVQGAVLADLLALWLAGHFVTGAGSSPAETAKLREQLLSVHIEAVRALIEPSEAEILASIEPGGEA